MEIKVFTNRPHRLDDKFPHSNELFCGDEYDDTDFPYLYMTSNTTIIIVAIIDNKVAGGIQLSESEDGWMLRTTNERPKWCMLGMGVNKEFVNQGIATKLIEKQFEIMDEMSIVDVCQSGYSEDGLKYIFPVYERMIEKYPHIMYINENRLF